jgi:cytochrome P450
MVFRDPPEHTRLRRLAAKVFNVRSIHALRPNIESTHALAARAHRRAREFDFIADFAGPLPALVIMDMLGVPREELARLKRLSDEMALFIGSARDAPEQVRPRRAQATREMAAHLPRAGRRAAARRSATC